MTHAQLTADSGKDTLTFLLGEPDPDPVFFAVAFHSSDRVWIIDSPADVGEALEEGIKQAWTEGVQAARTRERHCREIRLKGNPCELRIAPLPPPALRRASSTLGTGLGGS